MKYFKMINEQQNINKYNNTLGLQVLTHYNIYMPVLIFSLLIFSVTDVFARHLPTYVFTRIPTIVFSAVLFIINQTHYRNNNNLVLVLNVILSISVLSMGFGIIIISYHTEVFKASLLALVIFSFVVFFIARGKKLIWLSYGIPFVVFMPYILFFLDHEPHQLQELMNPVIIYISSLIASLRNENARINEHFYKESLMEERDRTEELYEETTIQNQELQHQKEEILTINEQLEQRKEELQINLEVISELNKRLKHNNKSITDSINYARRIQEAILPTDEKLSKVLSDYFVLYKPCEIVSGDFYWMHSSENYEIIAAVDCTGHGVPGGFMSMLGYSMLNDVVQNNKHLKANEILNRLKDKLKESLNQNMDTAGQADGLDIALCLINKKQKQIEFSGAYMPLTVLRNNELMHVKGDRMPIGRFIREIPSFTNHELTIEDNDVYYLYSDGFQDQIGGRENKRFLSKNLKKLLLDIGDRPFAEQREILDQRIEDWRGNNHQMDDILIIGFKLK